MTKTKTAFKTSAKKMTIACGLLAASLGFGASASAFSDLANDPSAEQIRALHERGIINGVTADRFAPKMQVTYAQAVVMLVKALDLEPQATVGSSSAVASHFFANVGDQTWYASAFLIAKQNGLPISESVKPGDSISRAAFAHLLEQGLHAKGEFATTMMYFDIADGGNLSNDVNNSLQTLLNTRIIELEEAGKFRPNDILTRSEAAAWLFEAAQFVEEVIEAEPAAPAPEYDSSVEVSTVAEGVDKAVLTVTVGHPGYGVVIDRIDFGPNDTAVIYYSVTDPDPDMMYPQVITDVTVNAYVPHGTKVTAIPSAHAPVSISNPSAR